MLRSADDSGSLGEAAGPVEGVSKTSWGARRGRSGLRETEDGRLDLFPVGAVHSDWAGELASVLALFLLLLRSGRGGVAMMGGEEGGTEELVVSSGPLAVFRVSTGSNYGEH